MAKVVKPASLSRVKSMAKPKTTLQAGAKAIARSLPPTMLGAGLKLPKKGR
jgi:hypothetical protein